MNTIWCQFLPECRYGTALELQINNLRKAKDLQENRLGPVNNQDAMQNATETV